MVPLVARWQVVSEIIILEQFMRMISLDMAVWIKEHDPATAQEAAKLAERNLAARRDAQHSFGGRGERLATKSGGEGVYVQGKVSFACKQGDRTNKQEVRCYYCSELGHTMPFCPSRKVKQSALSYVPCPHLPHKSLQEHTTEILTLVLVNGQSAKALVDTGSTQILVHDSF